MIEVILVLLILGIGLIKFFDVRFEKTQDRKIVMYYFSAYDTERRCMVLFKY